jgi:hypothetical protein
MKIIADLAAGRLILPDAEYLIGSRARTLRDGTRGAQEVVYSIPDKLPYDPRPFPKGLWNITGVAWEKEKKFDYRTYGPVKILTDAWQMVNVWELDASGDYLRETDERVRDTGYWLHYSTFSSTLGCIRLGSPDDAIAIASTVAEALRSEAVLLEVV